MACKLELLLLHLHDGAAGQLDWVVALGRTMDALLRAQVGQTHTPAACSCCLPGGLRAPKLTVCCSVALVRWC